MNNLKEFVRNMFFGIPKKLWNDKDVKYFIQKAISLDSDVYEEIIDISRDDLYQHLAEYDQKRVLTELDEIQRAMFDNAKTEIGLIIEDIDFDIEEAEQERKARQKKHQSGLVLKTINITDAENERLEGISFDNQRLM